MNDENFEARHYCRRIYIHKDVEIKRYEDPGVETEIVMVDSGGFSLPIENRSVGISRSV